MFPILVLAALILAPVILVSLASLTTPHLLLRLRYGADAPLYLAIALALTAPAHEWQIRDCEHNVAPTRTHAPARPGYLTTIERAAAAPADDFVWRAEAAPAGLAGLVRPATRWAWVAHHGTPRARVSTTTPGKLAAAAAKDASDDASWRALFGEPRQDRAAPVRYPTLRELDRAARGRARARRMA